MCNPVSAMIRVGESKNPIKDSVGVFGNVIEMELNHMYVKRQLFLFHFPFISQGAGKN